MSVLGTIEHALGKTEQFVEPLVEKVFGKQAAQELESLTLTLFSDGIGKLVKDTVALVATLQIVGPDGSISFANGATQRLAALKILENDALIIAKNVSTSVLNLLIEIAVQWVSKGGAAVAAAAASAAAASQAKS